MTDWWWRLMQILNDLQQINFLVKVAEPSL